MLSLFPSRARPRTSARAARPADGPVPSRPEAIAVLQPLLARLAVLPDDDAAAVAALHLDAVRSLDDLVAHRLLPARSALRGPVSAARLSATLVGAWEHATRRAEHRAYR